MNTDSILIILSAIVISSYLFDLIFRHTKIPSVLLLLFAGMGLHLITGYFGIETIDFLRILPTLGTLGLIMIVLEGALELRYESEKKQYIKKAFFSSFFILLLTVSGITFIFHYFTGESFKICFLNAIPYSIISSAIAIPSASNLRKDKKEFVIYESSFSDILGIVLFNFALSNDTYTPTSFMYMSFDIGLILLISAAFCFSLLYILGRINHQVKFFLIISVLILVYSLGKQLHLSSLIIVLAFGIFLNNASQIKNKTFRKLFIYKKLQTDLRQLLSLSAESAFLLRTFFFIIFGFTISIRELGNPTVLLYGFWVVLTIYIIRFIYLKFIAKMELIPKLFITPRGLISILLFYSIPETLKVPELGSGLLFLVILTTSTLMTVGLLGVKKSESKSTLSPKSEHPLANETV